MRLLTVWEFGSKCSLRLLEHAVADASSCVLFGSCSVMVLGLCHHCFAIENVLDFLPRGFL